MEKIKILFLSIFCLLICVGFGAIIKHLPMFVSYEQIPDSEKVLDASSEQKVLSDKAKYDTLEELSEKAPYIIKKEGQEIFVTKDNLRLYKVDAIVSDFPQSDILMIEKGIVAENMSQLFELVAYMES